MPNIVLPIVNCPMPQCSASPTEQINSTPGLPVATPNTVVPASPTLPRQSADNVTTRKRNRQEDHSDFPRLLNLTSDFGLESPRALKRSLRSIEELNTSTPWDLNPPPTEARHDVVGNVNLQHAWLSLSPTQSERSSVVLACGLGLISFAYRSTSLGRADYPEFPTKFGPELIGTILQQRKAYTRCKIQR